MKALPPEAIQEVANYFQALAEPTRLHILNLLRTQPHNVGEIAAHTGFSSANVSRHLSVLAQCGLVARESRGNSAYYRIADPVVYQLCDWVCGSLARHSARFSPFLANDAAPQVPPPDSGPEDPPPIKA